jgi:hypothetical protein
MASSRSGDQTSEQEKILAKPVKASKKFSVPKIGVQSPGLSISEKASSAKASPWRPMSTKACVRKVHVASAVGDDSGYALVHVIDLFTSEEEASKEQAGLLELR